MPYNSRKPLKRASPERSCRANPPQTVNPNHPRVVRVVYRTGCDTRRRGSIGADPLLILRARRRPVGQSVGGSFFASAPSPLLDSQLRVATLARTTENHRPTDGPTRVQRPHSSERTAAREREVSARGGRPPAPSGPQLRAREPPH